MDATTTNEEEEAEARRSPPLFPTNLALKKNRLFCATYWEKVPDKLQEAAASLNLQLDPGSVVSQFAHHGKNCARVGNRPIADDTKRNLEKQCRLLWTFCSFIGDYESMLMLLHPTPKNVPSMKVETIEQCLRFKRCPRNKPLLKAGSDDPVLDILGEPMYAEGGWIAPKNEWLLTTAIADLHAANDQGGLPYVDACLACQEMPEEQRHVGCDAHKGLPRLTRRGDPTRAQLYKNCCKQMAKDGRHHEENGSSQLLPADLRFLRTHPLSAPSKSGLQMWTITLIGTLLFLRCDEFHETHEDHFCDDLFHAPRISQVIEELALKVCGKVDKKWCTLRVLADHQCPELCGARTLLVCLHYIGWKGGYIFPSQKELHDPPSDGKYKTCLDCQKHLNDFQDVCKRVLPKRDNLKVGCQTLRKTGHCIAIFGDGNRDDQKKSARHSPKSKDSPAHSKDAASAYELHKRNPNPMNNVRKWSNIRVESGGNAQVMAMLGGSDHFKIAELPLHFVRNVLKMREGHPREMDMKFLFQEAKSYVTSDAPEKKLNECLGTLQKKKADELRQMIDDVAVNRVRSAIGASIETKKRSLVTAMLPELPATPARRTEDENQQSEEDPKKKKKKKKHGDNDLPGRKNLTAEGMTTESKIELMMALNNKKEEVGHSALTAAASTFWKRHIKTTTLACLHNHFGGNEKAFAAACPNYKHSSFKCKGHGDSCS